MKKKLVGFLLAAFFVLSGVASAYSRCVDVNHRLDAATEHDAPSIHCADIAFNSSTQVSSSARSYSGEPDNSLASSSGRTDCAVAVTRYKQNKFIKRFSQQDLYQLEEVFRI